MFRFLVASVVIGFSSLAQANPFVTTHNPQSDVSLDYSHYGLVLKSSILEMGASTHKPPIERFVRSAVSRMQTGNVLITRQEGNRVMFHEFTENEVQALQALRDRLLSVPDNVPLSGLSRNEQLAYWLNLHNLIVMAEIADLYPITRLDPLFDESDAGSFLNARQFEIAGSLFSLADIQDHVVTNWKDPLVIYGFYMGAIGTPNIRTTPFSGADVYDQLEENAVDFVNSLRGTQMWSPSVLRVSRFYQRMGAMFPNFDAQMLAHIKRYAREAFGKRLISATRVSAKIEDWHIADLYNGKLVHPGGTRAFVVNDWEGNRIVAATKLPLHVAQLLRDREIKLRRREGTVEIEEIEENAAKDN